MWKMMYVNFFVPSIGCWDSEIMVNYGIFDALQDTLVVFVDTAFWANIFWFLSNLPLTSLAS
jgi:hypothetical protein